LKHREPAKETNWGTLIKEIGRGARRQPRIELVRCAFCEGHELVGNNIKEQNK
jgi:hypothetical protein